MENAAIEMFLGGVLYRYFVNGVLMRVMSNCEMLHAVDLLQQRKAQSHMFKHGECLYMRTERNEFRFDKIA